MQIISITVPFLLVMLVGLPLAQAQPETAAQIQGMIDVACENSIDRGLEYLASRQNDDGSFGTDRRLRGNVGICALAGLAFLSEGSTAERGRYAKQVVKCKQYLLANCHGSGFINNREYQSSGPMYGHGFALLFLAEAFGMGDDEPLRQPIRRAVQLLVETQNDAGGWRYQPVKNESDLSVTVCQMMALRAARNAGFFVPTDVVNRCVEYVKQCQNGDGGFSYRLVGRRESAFPRSAAAVVALQSAGIYEGTEIETGIEFLMKNKPPRNAVQSSYFYYGHYYAVQAVWQIGGQPWQDWFPLVRDDLVLLQQPNGSWTSRYSPEYSTAMSLIILQIPNNVLPIFQR